MSLLINQGIQKEYEEQAIINAKNVTAVIRKVILHPNFTGALKLTYEILAPKELKGRRFTDIINYDPNHKMAWRYVQLREYVGCPYRKGEGVTVDIERLLINKVVTVDLKERVDKNGDAWQNVTYIKPKQPTAQPQPEPQQEGTSTESGESTPVQNPTQGETDDDDWGTAIDIKEEDLPF